MAAIIKEIEMFRRTIRPYGATAAVALAFAGGMLASHASADQPYMHDALGQLSAARATLVTAVPDKGGHRLRAIAFVDRAIAEVRMGIDYERRN